MLAVVAANKLFCLYLQYEVFPFVLQALLPFFLQNNLLESDKEVRREDARCCKNQSTVPFFLLHLHNRRALCQDKKKKKQSTI